MNSKISFTSTSTPRTKLKNKLLILLYNDHEYTLFFPKEEIKCILLSNYFDISTNTLYEELIGNQQAEIDNNIIHIQNNNLIDNEEINFKLSLLQRIIDSFSYDSLSRELNIIHLIDTVSFYINLNLISLVKIILELFRNHITEKKLLIASTEDKVKIYTSITHTVAIIQEELSSKKCFNNQVLQYLNSLIVLFNEYISILISILIDINNKELELFINTVKKEYLVVEDINNEDKKYASFILHDRDYNLFMNIVKIVMITIINNKDLTNNAKLEILREIVNDNNRIITIHTNNNTNEYSLLELSHEMFMFFDNKIYSSMLTRAYISNIANNKNKYDNLIKIIKLILDLNNETEDDLSLDSNQLTNKIINMNKLLDFNKCSSSNNKEQINVVEGEGEYQIQAKQIKTLENEVYRNKTIIEDLNSKLISLSDEKDSLIFKNTSLIDHEDQYRKRIEELLKDNELYANKNEELRKDREDLIKRNNVLIELNTKTNDDINLAVDTLNNILENDGINNKSFNELIEELNSFYPKSLGQLNSLKNSRGYNNNSAKFLINSLYSYNNENVIYSTPNENLNESEILDDQIIKYISHFTQFNSVGDITNNKIFNLLSDKDKNYSHCLIKDKYINDNPLIGPEDFKLDFNNRISFSNTCNCDSFCIFRDELNRNIVAITEETDDDLYISKIFQLENKELIQTFKESTTEPEFYYYKDVLDLSDVKDYFIICNIDDSLCHIFLLNKNTKLFELKKFIKNNCHLLKVLPSDNLKNNLMILYDVKNIQDMYELETNNAKKISNLIKVSYKFYSSIYYYDRINKKENSYIVECSKDKVKLFYSNIVHKEYKTFYTVQTQNSYMSNVILVSKNKDKYVYCSCRFKKIFIFNYEDQALIKIIGNSCYFMYRLSASKILNYSSDKESKFLILDINSNTIMETVNVEKEVKIPLTVTPIVLNSNKNYISIITNSNEISFVIYE